MFFRVIFFLFLNIIYNLIYIFIIFYGKILKLLFFILKKKKKKKKKKKNEIK